MFAVCTKSVTYIFKCLSVPRRIQINNIHLAYIMGYIVCIHLYSVRTVVHVCQLDWRVSLSIWAVLLIVSRAPPTMYATMRHGRLSLSYVIISSQTLSKINNLFLRIHTFIEEKTLRFFKFNTTLTCTWVGPSNPLQGCCSQSLSANRLRKREL